MITYAQSLMLVCLALPGAVGCTTKEASPVVTQSEEISSTIGSAHENAAILDPVDLIGARPFEASISGSPKQITLSGGGTAVSFDGVDDGIFLETNPLEGLSSFTIEIVFRADADGTHEQRFFHIGEVKTDRMLLELRMLESGEWYLDSFLRSGNSLLSADRSGSVASPK